MPRSLRPAPDPLPAPAAPERVRAVIYARVSSDPRQQLRSVSQQVDECRAECERRGWTLTEVFIDNDRSASRYAVKERPEYRRLILALRSGAVDVLLTWESSRAQRDLGAYVRLRRVAEENGVRWCYKGRLYDLSRTDDRFTTGLDALLDERESGVTRDRILRDKEAHARKGLPHGRLLYGYRREYDADTGAFTRQVPDEEQAPIVGEVARRVAAGDTLRAIARDLNTRGLRTRSGALWRTSSLSRMVTNPGYIGRRVHRGVVIGEARWPPLIEEDLFHACVRRLSAPGRAYAHGGTARHLLSGIAVCGVCGGRLAAIGGGARAGYACRGAAPGAPAKCVVMRRARLDGHVTRVVLARLARPDVAELLGDRARDDGAREALAEAARKRARLDGFYDGAAEGRVSPEALARIEARLLPEIRAAERRAAEAWGTATGTAPTHDGGRAGIAGSWPGLSLSRRREVITTLLDVALLPHRPGSRDDPSLRIRIDWKSDLWPCPPRAGGGPQRDVSTAVAPTRKAEPMSRGSDMGGDTVRDTPAEDTVWAHGAEECAAAAPPLSVRQIEQLRMILGTHADHDAAPAGARRVREAG